MKKNHYAIYFVISCILSLKITFWPFGFFIHLAEIHASLLTCAFIGPGNPRDPCLPCWRVFPSGTLEAADPRIDLIREKGTLQVAQTQTLAYFSRANISHGDNVWFKVECHPFKTT